MGPAPFQGYNANARRSTAGSRKKGKIKKQPIQADANALVHVPKSDEQRAEEAKERLKEQLIAESESKWNSKKKKRLDKYIDKKLKKEERVQILQKLSQTQAELPDSLHLQSSSTLGTGFAHSHKERLEQAEDMQTRKSLDGRGGKRKRNDNYDISLAEDEEEDEDEDLDASGSMDIGPGSSNPPSNVATSSFNASHSQEASTSTTPVIVGSALARNADGSAIAPKVRPRKQRAKQSAFRSWASSSKPTPGADSDTSFDSSDSAYDSSEGEADENWPEWTGVVDEDRKDVEMNGDEVSEEYSSEEESDEEQDTKPKRSLGFKAWATQQLHASKGLNTSDSAPPPSLDPTLPKPPPTKKRKTEDGTIRGPLGHDIALPDAERLGKARHVTINRLPEVEETRLLLPIVAEEQPIMEAILLNSVVIICGETGSGKTTQVPQFLYEAGFGSADSDNPGMIGVTQPRRVAAMSMASRVAHELSLTSSKVSYQIRYDATVSPSTSIKFMTDGVLLRELATDFLLSKYSVIIIDEAHERSMNTDILIGVLSRVLNLREQMWKDGKSGVKPLRLVIMSATLRVSDFAENKTLFPTPPPVINVAARQFPVTVHFSRRTSKDYVTESTKKATKIHTRLPPGGILIFLTGQNEIQGVCRKLEARWGKAALDDRRKQKGALETRIASLAEEALDVRTIGTAHADVEVEDLDLGITQDEDLAADVDTADVQEDPEALDSDDDEDDALAAELGVEFDDNDAPMHIVPLYSLLASDKQMKVFEEPPAGSRLVVVATNVAETSLTIPGIRYIIDCGRAKQRSYDIASGIQTFQVNWISKASASQRAGRAGRTGPGHCYRLYSSALFEHYFPRSSEPEILQMPIEGVVLQMKAMHIDAVVNFPFPTSPERSTLYKAESLLANLGALKDGKVTELGRAMSLFPLSPRFARMLVTGQQKECLPYVIAIVAALSVGDPFNHESVLPTLGEDEDEDKVVEEDEEAANLKNLRNEKVKAKEALRLKRKAYFKSQQTHSALGNGTSDMFRLLSVVGAFEYAGGGIKFCAQHFVRPKAMEEIHKLRSQLANIVETNFPSASRGFEPKLRPPSEIQTKILRQLLAAGFIDQVAIRKDRIEKDALGRKYTTTRDVPYRAVGIPEDVFIHPSSVTSGSSPPEYIVFSEVVRTSKVWLKGITVVNPAWLASLGKGTLCTFSKPTKNNLGNMMVIPRFGPEGWELPPVKAETVV